MPRRVDYSNGQEILIVTRMNEREFSSDIFEDLHDLQVDHEGVLVPAFQFLGVVPSNDVADTLYQWCEDNAIGRWLWYEARSARHRPLATQGHPNWQTLTWLFFELEGDVAHFRLCHENTDQPFSFLSESLEANANHIAFIKERLLGAK